MVISSENSAISRINPAFHRPFPTEQRSNRASVFLDWADNGGQMWQFFVLVMFFWRFSAESRLTEVNELWLSPASDTKSDASQSTSISQVLLVIS
jgi:hypothetical protein